MKYIPYGRQLIDESDIQAVVDTLRSDFLTTGPKVKEFEKAFALYVNARFAVALSSGTAALHSSMYAIGIGPGDEVIVPAITFAATANCVVYQGGIPVFADVEADTLLIDPQKVEEKITPRTKAIIAVDYAGQPCDYEKLREIAARHHIVFIADACHALGARYQQKKVGSIADLTVFSFHPVKLITTAEGGMVTTDNEEYAKKIEQFRNHGISADHHKRTEQGSWFYEIVDLGYNYRLTDIQCALGIEQLKKVDDFIKRRQLIADKYDVFLQRVPGVEPLARRNACFHAYHLYVVRVEKKKDTSRDTLFEFLRSRDIGVNVHYIPVHLHPFYAKKYKYKPGDFPVAEKVYSEILSLPVWPGMTDAEQDRVMSELSEYYV